MLSKDDICQIMTFCSKEILFKIFPKKGKLLYHSSQMLLDYKKIWSDFLDYRSKDILKCNNFFDRHIDTIGYEPTDKYKDSIYFDNRVESIFVYRKQIFLDKKLGKILLENSYEYYANIALRFMVNKEILPWIHNLHNKHILTTEDEQHIAYVYQPINRTEDTPRGQLHDLCRYLYSLIDYFSLVPRYNLPNDDKLIIKKIVLRINHLIDF